MIWELTYLSLWSLRQPNCRIQGDSPVESYKGDSPVEFMAKSRWLPPNWIITSKCRALKSWAKFISTWCSFYMFTICLFLSIRPIFINLCSKCTENIMILMYTTHKHITTLFLKIPSPIPKDHFQSSTEVLHGLSRHSIRHFLEGRHYCGFVAAIIEANKFLFYNKIIFS